MTEKNQGKAKTRKRKSFTLKLRNIAVFCLLVYAVVVLVSQQVTIAEKSKENSKIQSQIADAQQSNDEYTRLLAISDQNKLMEKLAIEKYGFAYPNETRVIDASGN